MKRVILDGKELIKIIAQGLIATNNIPEDFANDKNFDYSAIIITDKGYESTILKSALDLRIVKKEEPKEPYKEGDWKEDES